MAEESRGSADYLICRSTEIPDYSIWRVDIDGDELLSRVTSGTFDHTHQLIQIGNYILEWGPIIRRDENDKGRFPFRLFKFDATNSDPLHAVAVKEGVWEKWKFWGTRRDFGNPDGAAKEYEKGEKLMLVPLGTFVLWIMPTLGRGTFKLFHFDPASNDILIEFPTGIFGSFNSINFGHELIPLGNYVLDRLPDKREYCLWSFDPMEEVPLAWPPISEGRWLNIDDRHQLVVIGEHVLDWDTSDASYRLWRFDPKADDPLTGPVRAGTMPAQFAAQAIATGFKGNILTGIQDLRPIDNARKSVPGTIDFMRNNIKHVVYYMIENCSFDQICGWLYEKGEADITFVGRRGPFQGASQDMFNIDIDATGGPQEVHLEKWNRGEPPSDGLLEFLTTDPYHDMTDVMRQYFFNGHQLDFDGYASRAAPHMGGFVWNNGVRQVMLTYTPDQLRVLNGLARAFAVSDEWFCSTPGATDANRAFALTGSALRQLDNFMNGPRYINWPDLPHRPSIWTVLWANGFTDWKIYYSMLWGDRQGPKFVLSYHLFLKRQIQTVDAESSAYLAGAADTSKYIGYIDQFFEDARTGNLPTFSYLEPIWIQSDKPATSYHPSGKDGKGPGEKSLNEIYEALKASPKWNETLLIISFDEHAGVFDHVAPPYAARPWPNDEVCGFHYDIMGPRVPTILVSPWIKEQTVFRSSTPVAYDLTSILATLLHWCGIPKARWGLGDRTERAPTFEEVFQCPSPRSDKPSFESPPAAVRKAEAQGLTDLDELMAWRATVSIIGDKMNAHEATKVANDILERAPNMEKLNELVSDLAKRMR